MRVLAFYSFKGGVGKTAAAVNVAWEAARGGLPTLFWDLDPQGASSWYLGHDAGLRGSARKLVRQRQPVGREVCRTPWESLHLLPADKGYRHLDLALSKADAGARTLADLLRPLSEEYALTILDCPPSYSRLAESVFRAADLMAVPVIPTPLSLRVWEELREHFRDDALSRKRLVPFLSMVDRRRRMHREWTDGSGPSLKRQTDTWIPYASHVEQMGLMRAPVGSYAPRSDAAGAYRKLWSELRRHLDRLPQRNPV